MTAYLEYRTILTMPYKDKAQQRAYFREYKKRNRERLLSRRRELYRPKHPPANWSIGHSGFRLCVACGGHSDNKPLESCPEPKHLAHYFQRNEKNNKYRRRKRAEARSQREIWDKEDPQKRRIREARKYRKRRMAILNSLGGACAHCGYDDYRALELDHIHGGGAAERRAMVGAAYWRYIAGLTLDERRTRYQVLCSNCNKIKKEENREYGPQK